MGIDKYQNIKRCNIAFGGMQGSYYAAMCVYFGFLISYLTSTGYSNLLVGMVSTVIASATLIAQPLTGYIIDSFVTPKRLLRISSLLSVPFLLLFFIFKENQGITLALIAVIAVFFNPLGGVIDSWSVRMNEQGVPINYPITRSMGSILYSFTALIMGYIISKAGYGIMLPAYLVALGSMLAFSFLTQDVPCKNKSDSAQSGEKRVSLPEAFKILMSNRAYLIFIISYFFYNIAMRVTVTFVTPILQERGGTPNHLGIALFIAAFFELPILLVFSKYVLRLKLAVVYIISLLLGLIRIGMLNLFQNIEIVMLSQFFQGFSFGISIPFIIEYVNRIVPEKLKATAITIGLAVGSGAALIIGNSLGGVVMEAFGAKVFIYAMSVCILVSVAVFVVPLLIAKAKGQTIIQEKDDD